MPTASGWASSDTRSRHDVITSTCPAEISPAATADATPANTGGSGSPVTARRGPRSCERSTLARASRGETRNRSTNKSTGELRAYSPAMPRSHTSATSC